LDALVEVGEVVFDALYEQASSKERQLLHLMAQEDSAVSRTELADMPKAKELAFKENTISTFLRRLINKGLVKQTERHKYGLLDRFLREYLISVRGVDMGN